MPVATAPVNCDLASLGIFTDRGIAGGNAAADKADVTKASLSEQLLGAFARGGIRDARAFYGSSEQSPVQLSSMSARGVAR